jgi:hypothetical protein
MEPPVPGETFDLRLSFWNGSRTEVRLKFLRLHLARGWHAREEQVSRVLAPNETWSQVIEVGLDEDAAVFRPHLSRSSIAENLYRGSEWFRGAPRPLATAEIGYEADGVDFTATETVKRLDSQLPFGDVARELVALPALTVSARPRLAILPLGSSERRFEVTAEVRNHSSRPVQGRVSLVLPEGVRSEPEAHEIDLAPLESRRLSFAVTASSPGEGERRIRVVATAGARSFSESYQPIAHRDLETRYLVTPADVRLLEVDVQVPEGLRVGYVEGVGDEIPESIEALGVSVDRLSARDLADAPFDGYAAIVLGTRAYAVREDLVAHNGRLLSYVEAGGHLVVLYNTPEFRPTEIAPYPGSLPEDAEEVTEEDSPVEILAPDHPLLRTPNRITPADFDDWVEQRGSKFWSEWDSAYVSLIATHDEGQAPQKGGWLVARHGKGYYTYFAYALHRQLPYGVPGSYRILANLLSARLALRSARSPRSSLGEDGRIPAATRLRRGRFLPAGLAPLACSLGRADGGLDRLHEDW